MPRLKGASNRLRDDPGELGESARSELGGHPESRMCGAVLIAIDDEPVFTAADAVAKLRSRGRWCETEEEDGGAPAARASFWERFGLRREPRTTVHALQCTGPPEQWRKTLRLTRGLAGVGATANLALLLLQGALFPDYQSMPALFSSLLAGGAGTLVLLRRSYFSCILRGADKLVRTRRGRKFLYAKVSTLVDAWCWVAPLRQHELLATSGVLGALLLALSLSECMYSRVEVPASTWAFFAALGLLDLAMALAAHSTRAHAEWVRPTNILGDLLPYTPVPATITLKFMRPIVDNTTPEALRPTVRPGTVLVALVVLMLVARNPPSGASGRRARCRQRPPGLHYW